MVHLLIQAYSTICILYQKLYQTYLLLGLKRTCSLQFLFRMYAQTLLYKRSSIVIWLPSILYRYLQTIEYRHNGVVGGIVEQIKPVFEQRFDENKPQRCIFIDCLLEQNRWQQNYTHFYFWQQSFQKLNRKNVYSCHYQF